jgi:hypothetical protein
MSALYFSHTLSFLHVAHPIPQIPLSIFISVPITIGSLWSLRHAAAADISTHFILIFVLLRHFQRNPNFFQRVFLDIGLATSIALPKAGFPISKENS